MSETTFGAIAQDNNSTTLNADRVEKELSVLDLLKAEAKKEISRTVAYAVEEREGWSAEYDTSISLQDYNRYTRSAQGKKKDPKDADAAIFSGMALVERNTRIMLNGKPVQDSDGDLLTFRSEEFIAMFDADSAVEALRKFMGDGHMVSTAGALYREAGYAEEAKPEDPTEA